MDRYGYPPSHVLDASALDPVTLARLLSTLPTWEDESLESVNKEKRAVSILSFLLSSSRKAERTERSFMACNAQGVNWPLSPLLGKKMNQNLINSSNHKEHYRHACIMNNRLHILISSPNPWHRVRSMTKNCRESVHSYISIKKQEVVYQCLCIEESPYLPFLHPDQSLVCFLACFLFNHSFSSFT